MRQLIRRFCFVLLLCGCVAGCDFGRAAGRLVPASLGRTISFSVLEDYDKGTDLNEIAKDFQLMRELGIDVLRCSLGWDDYEPVQGRYDFAWLKEFVQLAARYDIKLRPYIGYTPGWAGAPGSDDQDWNNPPRDYRVWYRFVYNLAYALRDYPNVLSYEIYNEQNARLWWDGSIEQYQETLRHAALAIRAADSDAQVVLGGFVFADDHWLSSIVRSGHARYYDITPFHAYPETWTPNDVSVENYLDARYRAFVRDNRAIGEGEPIWINEMGFATTAGKSDLDQANWWARAVSTFVADPYVEHIGVYEIKDLPASQNVIGDEKNYHLGLARTDRTKKAAFYTVALLKDLLGTGPITSANDELTVTVDDGEPSELYWRLFRRWDGKQVLFMYDKAASPALRVRLRTPGATALQYDLNGRPANYTKFDGYTLSDVRLTAGQVAIFRIDP
jgi:polysaccharide biosynthesis protein PslG